MTEPNERSEQSDEAVIGAGVGSSHPFAAHVLYEDHHLLIVNKPAPLLTQAPPGVPNLEEVVKSYIKEKYAKPAGVYLGVPHRLDRPVSGVVCFARNTKAAQRVHAQFAERSVRKVYWALVEGVVDSDAGAWDDWIRKIADEARVERAEAEAPGAKLATLEYRVLQRLDSVTHIELEPLTGRMHQLRVQTAWRGHPVLGDTMYGGTRAFGPAAELPRDHVVALHARRLTITHPFTKQELTVEAPLPAYWSPLLGASLAQ
ncbi:pseudouridine synthase : Putative 23S rRNA pseudouridine synthase OS=Blastopirellula marina DSM 3645 GN=DSM3645_04715 PE=4 SV=1: PseudoU_synth_2 [Gemmata massiliana]|uniref:Pseudouridine synthase RsuA/RluA-like domain-containing protein n=1 Tax=Gemmata massiliana TaxID=1210884 RepID=A0A6P2CWA8_9BACT|nr:RluA family pseudouridine synthase [Gemmata massiliana]VTR91450.1 pseudouridine synthase : Putative 23S rRNA pseudouridine synthase OS=Blastopirellula marina DSM 3645 GN=DSM3645_04715 PE=4 SV=1: PseudoU_synth_2 [Gemmata massiliana]